MSEVTVDDKHLLSLDGEAQSQVSSDKRLTRTWIERCKQDCILVLVLCHEVDICAHHSECFVYNITATFLNDVLSCLYDILLILVLFLKKCLDNALLGRAVWNFSHKWNNQSVKVFLAPDFGVETLACIDDSYGDDESEGKGNEQYLVSHWRCGFYVTHWRCDDSGVVCCKCL